MDRNQRRTSRFDRTNAKGRLEEMSYLDSLTDEELAATDPGHQLVSRNPSETEHQGAVLLQRLDEAEERYGREPYSGAQGQDPELSASSSSRGRG